MNKLLIFLCFLGAPLVNADNIRRSFFEIVSKPADYNGKRVGVFGFVAFQPGRDASFALFPTKDHALNQVLESGAFLDLKSLTADQFAALQNLESGTAIRVSGTMSLAKGTWDLFAFTLKVDAIEVLQTKGATTGQSAQSNKTTDEARR